MNTSQSLRKARYRAIMVSVPSNTMEFYDTTIYAFFAIYFAGHFFPSDNQLISQISAYAVFGLSFFVRPFGGILVSYYADKIGRKPIVAGLTLVMALTTGLVGLLPTYAQAGMLAPILLILLRLIQAVAIGGLFSTTTAFLMEFAPPNRRGFFTSIQMLAQALAPIIANIVALSMQYTIGHEAIVDVGWRLPFLIGFITAPLSYYIYKCVDETPDFSDYIKKTELARSKSNVVQLTIGQTLRQPVYVAQILRCIALNMVGTVSFYGVFVYLPGFIQSLLRLSDIQRYWISLITPTFTLFGVALSGYCSDKLSRKTVMLSGITIFGIAFFSFFYYLTAGNANYNGALIGMSIIGFSIGAHWGVVPIMFSESYPVAIRASAISITYNTGVVLFGAMTPTYLSILTMFFGDTPMNPIIYIGTSIVVSFIAALVWRKASDLKVPEQLTLS
ncbi:MHS family proline/betaine transporter-like MFS transporter [Orbus hercynius]|uniref:MHS family proline/betaine transporter-like MFS transporter n=1 Tax=Orbus hercynius TaxID=593135 RepID=A0A495RJD5_9GAMM|nr:MFS transporter [Orbus hercynius]RKS87555.1 MHS family proline/betaine transporter-like MFS transporter [Orbus hercynius]